MIQPSIERTATAPEEVCWSVVEGLEPLRGGELSISISLDAIICPEWLGFRVRVDELGWVADDCGVEDGTYVAICIPGLSGQEKSEYEYRDLAEPPWPLLYIC